MADEKRTRRGNGEGSIKEWKPGTYRAAIWLGAKRHWFYGKSRKEVQAKISAARRAHEDGRDLGSAKQTAGDYLDTWLRDVVRRSRKATTYDNYRLNIERAKPHIGAVRLDQLKAAHLDKCYATMLDAGLSRRSVEQCHTVLRAAFRHAVKGGTLSRPPTFAATPPRPERKEMQTLTSEQVQTLFDSTKSDRLHALWVLLTTSGLRIGEATALRWEDIDWKRSRLAVRHTAHRVTGKGIVIGDVKTKHSRRVVHLAESTVAALQGHMDRQDFERRKAAELWDEQGLVFTTVLGKPLDAGTLNDSLHIRLASAGLPHIRVHDLRHTCATLLLQRGVHPKVVQELLGHSTITLTMDTYSHVIPAMHQEVASHMDALFSTPRA